MFNPQNPENTGWRWHNFYKYPEAVEQILSWMVSRPNSKLACQTAEKGMVKVIETVVAREADRITKNGVLRPPDVIDTQFVLGMKFSELPQKIKERCPTIYRVLMAIAKTKRQERECTAARIQHKSFVSPAFANHHKYVDLLVY